MPRPLEIKLDDKGRAICRAKSSQTGLPCKRPPMRGGNVCRSHGGGAPQVKKAAANRMLASYERVVDPKRVLTEVGCIGFSNIQDLLDDDGKFLPIKDWPEDAARAVASVEIVKKNVAAGDGVVDDVLKIRFWDKPRKLENSMKHHGQLTEKLELTGNVNILERLVAGRKRVAEAKKNADGKRG